MKKVLFGALLVLIVLAVVLNVDYLTNLNVKKGNEFVTQKTAVENVKKKLDTKSIETITNFNTPKIEETVFDKQCNIYLFDKETEINGKKLYKITFNTTMDELLGPIVFYVDKISGEVVGTGFRE